MIDWSQLNWKCQDTVIAEVTNVSKEYVRQCRIKYGNGVEAEHKREQRNSDSYKFQEFVKANVENLHGKTAYEIIKLSEIPISTTLAYGIIRTYGVKLLYKKSGRKQLLPWSELNWKLSNIDLLKIWNPERKFNIHRIMQRRCEGQFGKATLEEGMPEYEIAIKEEKLKAEFYFSRECTN